MAVTSLSSIFKPISPTPIRAKAHRRHADIAKNKPILYKADALPELLKVATPEPMSSSSNKVIRFLLTPDQQLIFGLEGYPDANIPAHFQMANFNIDDATCLTAGNMFFNEKGELCGINHKSRDFRAPFDTLQFLFPILLKQGIKLADEIFIGKLNSAGAPEQTFMIEAAEIKRFVEATVAPHTKPTPIPTLESPTSDIAYFGMGCIVRLADGSEIKTGD